MLELLEDSRLHVFPYGVNNRDAERRLRARKLRGDGCEELPGRIEVLDAASEEERRSKTAALL